MLTNIGVYIINNRIYAVDTFKIFRRILNLYNISMNLIEIFLDRQKFLIL